MSAWQSLCPSRKILFKQEKTVVNSESKSFFLSRLGPESSLMGERRHKDEVDSADDSDGGRAEQEEVEI